MSACRGASAVRRATVPHARRALPFAGAALLGATALAAAAASPGSAASADEVHFVSCPIYRDTNAGRKSGCWLADDPATGARYDVTLSPSKPDWNRAVLVEGLRSARQDDACGGVTLDPVRVSVLDEPCTRAKLPAEGYAGRTFVLPPRNLAPTGVARPIASAPRTNRTFHAVFDFGRTFVVYQLTDYLLDEAASYAVAVRPRHVVVTGHAATSSTLVSGHELHETAGLAMQRAEVVAEWLRRSGVPGSAIEIRTGPDEVRTDVVGADGLLEPSRRRVDIDVVVD